MPRRPGPTVELRRGPRTASRPARARVKLFLLVALVLSLIGIVAYAGSRDVPDTQTALRRPALPTPRPALSAAEERYIESLWPIHADVERSLMRMTLAQIFYKSNNLGRAELKTRVNDALAMYRQAEVRISALEPPQSLQGAHHDYLSAVRQLEDSAVEILRMYDDGSDDHLQVAYPLSQQASDKIRDVGGSFWPYEFPPN